MIRKEANDVVSLSQNGANFLRFFSESQQNVGAFLGRLWTALGHVSL